MSSKRPPGMSGTWTYSASSPTGSAANNKGVFPTDGASLSWATEDFGRFVLARPAGVFRPGPAAEIAATLTRMLAASEKPGQRTLTVGGTVHLDVSHGHGGGIRWL